MSRFHELRRRYTIEDATLIGLVIVVSAIALAIGINPILVLIVGGIFIAYLVVLLVSYSLMVTKAVKNREVILSHDVWAHWEYDRETWMAFINNRAIQAEMNAQAAAWVPILRSNGIAIGLLVAVGLGILLRRYGWPGFVGASLLGLGFFGFMYRSALRTQRILAAPYPLTAADPTDVYIGAAGLGYPGNHVLFSQPKLSVVNARVDPGDPAILRIGTRYEFGKTTIAYDILVPVPPGKEQEASRVVDNIIEHLVPKLPALDIVSDQFRAD
jgi:hypothetical protein